MRSDDLYKPTIARNKLKEKIMQKWKQNKTKQKKITRGQGGKEGQPFSLCGINSLSQGRIAKDNNKS